jgi:hypothetical protein
MKTRTSFSVMTGLIAGSAAIALSQTPVHAASFSFSANDASVRSQCPAGSTTCYINDFFKVSAAPEGHQITQKQVNNVWGFGVAVNGRNPKDTPKDPSEGEIDAGETLQVDFAKATGETFKGILESLELSFLYRPGTFGDQVFEMALVSTDGKAKTGTLQVKNATTAVWKLDNTEIVGAVTSVSPSTNAGGGSYRIQNPFADFVMQGFSLTAVPVSSKNGQACNGSATNCPQSFRNSDFTLTAVSAKKVPEPASLLGLGVVGLLAATQRRRTAKTN